MNLLRGLVAVALLSGLTACTNAMAGTPHAPWDKAVGSDKPATSTAPPGRPREVRLDTVDPCTLVPRADYPDYYMDEPGKPELDESGAPECAWDGTDIGFFGINLRTYEGIDVWLDGSRSGIPEWVDPVLGFPALTLVRAGDENFCMVGVDVADGQTLMVMVGYDLNPPARLPPICEYTHQFATTVMGTLVGQ